MNRNNIETFKLATSRFMLSMLDFYHKHHAFTTTYVLWDPKPVY